MIGDHVNLASRLEGITKTYGVQIVISEYTHREVHEYFETRELDSVRCGNSNGFAMMQFSFEHFVVRHDSACQLGKDRVGQA